MNLSAACSALDALDRQMVQVTPLGIQGEGCRLGEKTHKVLDRRPGADSPRRQAALPASRRRYVTVLQGEGSLRRRHRMFGIEQGLNELDHGQEHARHVTAGVVLGLGPKTLSSARSARNSVAADPVAVAGYVTAAQCNRDAPDGFNLVCAATCHFGDPRRGIPARPFLPGTRVLSFSRASSTTAPADALRGPGPLGAREGAGDIAAGCIERSARPLPVAGAGLDQAAQRLVCGAAPRAVLDGHLIARQADRAVDLADGTGPASSRTPYPTAEQAGPQVLRAPVAAALSSPPPDPLPGLAAALRGLTHEAARFPQLIIIYDQIPDRRRGRGSQPEYTLTKPSNGPNDRDHLIDTDPRSERREPRVQPACPPCPSKSTACVPRKSKRPSPREESSRHAEDAAPLGQSAAGRERRGR